MELLKKIIAKVKPNNDLLRKDIKQVVDGINSELKRLKIKAVAVIGGSFAKDTHLIGDHDCDIFVRFDYKYKDAKISDLLEKALKKFKAVRVHGSRDYFQFSDKLNYEIVPVLNVSNPKKAMNVTDISPLHVSWTKKKNKSDQIRLAKAFCKSNGTYGAESYIKGFSGHVLDILTIKYGSFMNLLKASQKWKDKTVIDISKHYKNAEDALFKLNASKTQNPLIVVDPIQPDRNAAAALGFDSFNVFVKKAKEFLKNPSEKFFEKKVLTKQNFENAIIIDVVPLSGKRDVVGAKIMKAHDAILRVLESNEFKVEKSGWVWDKETFIWFKIKNEKLNNEKIIQGPPVKLESFAANFKKVHKNAFEKSGRLFAKIKREYVNVTDLIKNVIKTEEIKEKIKSIKLSD